MQELDNFFNYHNYTHYSNVNGYMNSCVKPIEYIKLAKEYGMKSIAFSENGNIYNWIQKKKLVEENGLKYIHSIEMNITINKELKLKDNYKAILIAKNLQGVKEINKLSSKSFKREDNSFYYVPRIELKDLINTTQNIIVISSAINGLVFSHNIKYLKEFVKFAIQNKERVFLEVQPCKYLLNKMSNIKTLRLANKFKLNIIAGVSTYYSNEDTRSGRDILKLSKLKFKDNEEYKEELSKIKYEKQEQDYCFKSIESIRNDFNEQGILNHYEIELALNNNNLVGSMIEKFNIDREFKYPKLFEDSEKEFKKRIRKALNEKGIELNKEIKNRINREFKDYKDTNTIDYILLESEIKQYCKENNISYGYGRGSVTGSYIGYLLDIHRMNSLKYELNFERFINKERVSLADVDTDYTESGRDKIKNYLYNKKGINCSSIITFNTLALKGAIRDVGRALQIDLETINEITKDIEEKEEELRDEYPKLFKYVDILIGTIVSVGVHPAGTIVSPIPLDENIGISTINGIDEIVSQLDMKDIDYLNYVKLDLLGLKTLEVLEKTCNSIGIPILTPDNLDNKEINSIEIWKELGKDSSMVFQMDSDVGRAYCKELFSEEILNKIKNESKNFNYMNLLAIMNGAIRPAGDSYRNQLLKGEKHKYNFEPFNTFFEDTLGYCVFQEDIMKFLNKFCKMSMQEADLVRRGLAKGYGTEEYLPKIEENFVSFAKEKYNLSEVQAKEEIKDIIQVILDASNYAFSLNHSMPYSFIGYACLYLRTYYPLEFISSYLNVYIKNEKNFNKAIKYLKRHTNIEIKKPTFRKSIYYYNFNKLENSIYEGVGKYKRMNEDVGIVLESIKDKEYNNFVELLKDLKESGINSAQMKILIIEDFFREFGKNYKLLKIFELWKEIGHLKQIKLDKVDKLKLNHSIFSKYSNPNPKKTYMNLDMDSILKEHILLIEDKKINIIDMVKLELEYFNEIISSFPTLTRKYYYILNIKNRGIKLVEVYNLLNGEKENLWINDSETLQRKKIKKNSLIEIRNRTQKTIKDWIVIESESNN